jgi:hypothetical protein
MKPSIGRTVITIGIIHSNGTHEHPAIVTRVWSDQEPSEATVLCNLTVFPDCGTQAAITQGSVQIFDDRAAAENHLQANPGQFACFWPGRV